MHSNETTLKRLYGAFAQLDGEAMTACYAPDAVFEDEVFSLRGRKQIGGMWQMLCEATRAKGADVWKLESSAIQADAEAGRAHWEAHYRFSATGRMVHNIIDAAVRFNTEGLIVRHRDQFDFWRWSRQALGTPGVLLGWSPMLRNKVRSQAAANLQKYLERNVTLR